MDLVQPGLIVGLFVGVFWLVPIAAGVWALVTLSRIRKSQDEMRAQLATLLQRGQRE